MYFDIKDIHPAARDDVLDALNAVHRALDAHGIELERVPGESLSEHLDNAIAAFRQKLETMQQ